MANWFGLQIAVAGSEVKRLNLKRRGSAREAWREFETGVGCLVRTRLAVTRDKLAGVNCLSGRVQCSPTRWLAF
jgi:hypothetical protein